MMNLNNEVASVKMTQLLSLEVKCEEQGFCLMIYNSMQYSSCTEIQWRLDFLSNRSTKYSA